MRSIAVVDEDRSALSRQIVSGFLPPYFKTPNYIEERDIDRLMNFGRFTFVIDIPPYFERDVRAGRHPRCSFLWTRPQWFRRASDRAMPRKSSAMKSTVSSRAPNLSHSRP